MLSFYPLFSFPTNRYPNNDLTTVILGLSILTIIRTCPAHCIICNLVMVKHLTRCILYTTLSSSTFNILLWYLYFVSSTLLPLFLYMLKPSFNILFMPLPSFFFFLVHIFFLTFSLSPLFFLCLYIFNCFHNFPFNQSFSPSSLVSFSTFLFMFRIKCFLCLH